MEVLGEGSFSKVFKAQSLKNGNYVAIKCMKSMFNSIQEVKLLLLFAVITKILKGKPFKRNSSIEETFTPRTYNQTFGNSLVRKNQKSILMFRFSDEPTGRLALVFELMERNMYENIKDRKSYLSNQRIKSYIFQLLRSIDHMHKLGIFHRDIKP